MDGSKVTTEVVVKLFDTLRDSHKDVQNSVEKQTEALSHLNSLIKESVKPEDVRNLLIEHDRHQGEHLDNIDTCTETINDNSGKILSILKKLVNRVQTMILVVCVAFGLMTLSYFYVSSWVDNIITDKIGIVESEYEEHRDMTHQELVDEIEMLRKEIREMGN